MTADTQRTAQDAEKKLIEYQRNYFLKNVLLSVAVLR